MKIICVGKKGFDILRREFASLIIDRVDLREVKKIGFENADQIGKKIIGLFEKGEFDVCTLFYSEFKSVISQVPTALAADPRCRSGRGGSGRGRCCGDLRIRARRGRRSSAISFRATSRCRFSGLCSRMLPVKWVPR